MQGENILTFEVKKEDSHIEHVLRIIEIQRTQLLNIIDYLINCFIARYVCLCTFEHQKK